MAQKCVHQGCGKLFSDPTEKCLYHPGPPVFHEGQKGWKCCRRRVLDFNEFMSIPPCTTGTHSTTDLPPKLEEKKATEEADALASKLAALVAEAPPRVPKSEPSAAAQAPAAAPESDEDDASLEIAEGTACRRKACGQRYKKGSSREGEQCTHHPGAPIFHEGSKGYSCCKRRVLEFDEFLKIAGCQTKQGHLFVGSGKKLAAAAPSTQALLTSVRHDFYQTSGTLIASFFLKKIDKASSRVEFRPRQLVLDLQTSDSPPKRYAAEVPLFAAVQPDQCSHRVLGTKLEVTLAKAEAVPWPVLRSDDVPTGEILQLGQAATA